MSSELVMKEKSKLRFYMVLFSLAIFVLTALALFSAYSGWLGSLFLAFASVIAFALLLAFADFLINVFKVSARKVLLLTFSMMVMATVVTQVIWTIVTPNWTFSVSTDKSTYSLGENVNITVSLKNMGFITHSFKSKVNDPVLIAIFYWRNPYDAPGQSVWWNSPWKENITEFSIQPSQSLERSFIWNQTNIWKQIEPTYPSWNQTYMPGTYHITAFIPDAQADVINPVSYNYALFIKEIIINVISPGGVNS